MRPLAALLAVLLIASPRPTAAENWNKVADQLRASTQQVVMYAGGEIGGYCSAFSINDAKDYFLTAAHCVNGFEYLLVGGVQGIPIYVSLEADLAVLVVPDSGEVPALHLAQSVEQGQDIFNYGYGWGLEKPMFRAGHVSIVAVHMPANIELLVGPNEFFTFTDFAFVPGQSGGPVVDSHCRLVTVTQLGNDSMGLGRTLTEISVLVGKYFEKN